MLRSFMGLPTQGSGDEAFRPIDSIDTIVVGLGLVLILLVLLRR